MLSIRSAQQQGFKKAAEDLFSKEMLAYFKTFSPQQFARLGDKGASEVIRLGIEKAKTFGFTQRGPVKFFLELLFLFGLDFDRDKNMKWAMDLLKKGDVDQIERADQLYAALARNQPRSLPALENQLAAGGGQGAAAANGGAAPAAVKAGGAAVATASSAAPNPVSQMEIEQFSVKVKTGEQLLEEYKAAHPGEALPESPQLMNYATDIKTGAVPASVAGAGAPHAGLDPGLDPSSAAAMGHLSVAPDAYNAQGQIDPQRAHEKALLRSAEVDPKVKHIVAPDAVAAANPAVQPHLSFAEKTALASDQRIQSENKHLEEAQASALDQAGKSGPSTKQEGAGGWQDQLKQGAQGANAKTTAPNAGQHWQDAIGKAQAQAGPASANASAGGSAAAAGVSHTFAAQGAPASAAAMSGQTGGAAGATANPTGAAAAQAGTTASGRTAAGIQGGASAGTAAPAGAGGQAANAAAGAQASGGAATGTQGGASSQAGVTGGQAGNASTGTPANGGSGAGIPGGDGGATRTGAATNAQSGSAAGGQGSGVAGAQAGAGNGAAATAGAKTSGGAGSSGGQAAAAPSATARAVSANAAGGTSAGGTPGGSNGPGASPAAAAASGSAKKDWRANLKQQIEEKVKKEAKNQLKDAAEDMAIGLVAGQLGAGQAASPAHNPLSDMVIEQYSVQVKTGEQVLAEYIAAHPGEPLPESPMLAGYSSEITTGQAVGQAGEWIPPKGYHWTEYGWQWTNPDLPADHPMRKLVIQDGDGPDPNPENIPIGAVSDGKGGWNWSNPDIPWAKDIQFYDDDEAMAPSGNVLDMKSMPGMKVQRPSQTDKASEATDQTAEECPTLCPKKVEWQDNGAAYGYDDFTSKNTAYLSVEQGQSTSIMAVIVPGDKYRCVEFKSDNEGLTTAIPAKATSGSQVVTVDGKARGSANVAISCSGRAMKKFVVKCYPKKTKTVAVRLVHEKNYKSKDIADSAIDAYLKKVYNQAVCEFKVTRLPEKTVEFDLNKDKQIDVDSWMSKEMKRIVDACKDDSYDHNMFIVSHPSDGSYGFMMFNQRYGFVHADSNPVPEQAFAHELGHGGFGLTHTENDGKNVMYNYGGDKGSWRLRHAQWDLIHGAAASKSDASAKQTPLVDELTPIAQYIANEMNTNARSKDAQNMYGLNTYSAAECLDQYAKQPWFVKLIQSEWPNQCIDNSFNYPAAALLAWTINVRQGARWDHKTTIPKMFHPRDPNAQHWHRYSDAEHGDFLYYFDIWSNIHYGYVGKACGFSDSQLLDGAGLEQIGSDLVSLRKPDATGSHSGLRKWDHEADRETIQIGITLYKKYPNAINASPILQEILNANLYKSKKKFPK